MARLGLGGLSIKEQCRVLGVSRAGYYAWLRNKEKPAPRKDGSDEALEMANVLMDAWTGMPFMGYQKMARELQKAGYEWATEKRIRKLYKQLGLKGLSPRFKTTRSAKHPYGKFPYLLKGRRIRYVNEVWATDITYIKLPGGMVYFTAVIDLYSRKILAWRLSNTMDASFCIECMGEAIEKYGCPAIVNQDQGSQYTSREYIEFLESYGIQISMDGRGSWRDNVIVERSWRTLKYECVFLHDYQTMAQLEQGLNKYIKLFNSKRVHQGLGYQTPDEVYSKGCFPLEDNENKKEQIA